MRVSFRSIPHRSGFAVDVALDSSNCSFLHGDEIASLRGSMARVGHSLVRLEARFVASLGLVCCVSGDEFVKFVDQDLALFFSDGLHSDLGSVPDGRMLDVLDFYDGVIDLDFVIQSEIQSIRLDYNTKE